MLEEKKARDFQEQVSADKGKTLKTSETPNSDAGTANGTAKRIQTINPSRRCKIFLNNDSFSSPLEHCTPCPTPRPLTGPQVGGLPGSSLLFGQQAATLRLAQLKAQIALAQISNALSFGNPSATFTSNSNKSVPYVSSAPPSPTAAAINLLNLLKIANTMSHPLYNPYASGNQSSSQGQYGRSDAERDPRRASSLHGPGSSLSSSRSSSAVSNNSGRMIPPLMPQLRNYRSEQSRTATDAGISSPVNVHMNKAREEVRHVERSGHRSLDQDAHFSSTFREEFGSSDTRLGSQPMSSTYLGQRHNLNVQGGSSSLDWSSKYNRPTASDSKPFSQSASSSYASRDEDRFNPSVEGHRDMQAIPGLGDYDCPSSHQPAASAETSRPKYSPETAASILLHFGLEKEDLEQLISYPEDQITPANLPFILRQICSQKDKRAATGVQSNPNPELNTAGAVGDSYSLNRFGGAEMQQEKTSTGVFQSSRVIDYGHTGKYTGSGAGDETGRKSNEDVGRIGSMYAMDSVQCRQNPQPQQKNTTEWKSTALGSSQKQASSFTSLSSSSSSALSSAPSASNNQTNQRQTQPNPTFQSILGLLSLTKKDTNIRGFGFEASKPFTSNETKPEHQSTLNIQPAHTMFHGMNPSHPGPVLSGRSEASDIQKQSKTSVVVEHIVRKQGNTNKELQQPPKQQKLMQTPQAEKVHPQQPQNKQMQETLKKQAQTQQTQRQHLQQPQKQAQTQQTQRQHLQQPQKQAPTQQTQIQQTKQTQQTQKQQKQQAPTQIPETQKQQVQQTQKKQTQPASQMGQTAWPPTFSSATPAAPVPLLSWIPGNLHPNFPPPVPGLVTYNHIPMLNSKSQSTTKLPLSKIPHETMMNDYAATPPKLFPHVCSLCNRNCTDMQDWISHQNSGLHLQSCKQLCIKYPEWADEIDDKSRRESYSWSKSPSPRRHHGSEGGKDRRRSRSRSPRHSRHRHRSRSRSHSRSRSRSPRHSRISSRHRSRSRSHERRSSPRRSDRRGSTPRRRDRRGSTPRRRDRRGSTPRRRDRRGSTPRRSRERRSPPRRKRERASSTEESSRERERQGSAERLAKKLLETSGVQSLSDQSDLESVVKSLAPALVAELAKIKSSSSGKGTKPSSSPSSADGKRSSSTTSSSSSAAKTESATNPSGKSSPATMVKLLGVQKALPRTAVLLAVEHFGKTKSVVVFRASGEAVVIFEKEEDAKKLKNAKSLNVSGTEVNVARDKEAVSTDPKTSPQKKPATASVSTPESTNKKIAAPSASTEDKVKTSEMKTVSTQESPKTSKPVETEAKAPSVRQKASSSSKTRSAENRPDVGDSKLKPVSEKTKPSVKESGARPKDKSKTTEPAKDTVVQAKVSASKAEMVSASEKPKTPMDKKPTGKTTIKGNAEEKATNDTNKPIEVVVPSNQEKLKESESESLEGLKGKSKDAETADKTGTEPPNEEKPDKAVDVDQPIKLDKTGVKVAEPVEVGILTQSEDKDEPNKSQTISSETTVKALTQVQQSTPSEPESEKPETHQEMTEQHPHKDNTPPEHPELPPPENKEAIDGATIPPTVLGCESVGSVRQQLQDSSEASERFDIQLPASESQTSDPPAELPSTVEPGDPAGSSVSEPLAAELSASAVKEEVKTEEVQSTVTGMVIDSIVGSSCDENVVKMEVEEKPPTSLVCTAEAASAVKSENKVPTSSVPDPPSSELMPEEESEGLPQIDTETLQALAAAVRQHRVTLASRSKSKGDESPGGEDLSSKSDTAEGTSQRMGQDNLKEDVSSGRRVFDQPNLNLDDFVTVDEVGDDAEDPNAEPQHSSSSTSKRSCRGKRGSRGSGSRRISTRSSKDLKSTSSSSPSVHKPTRDSPEHSKSPNKPSSSSGSGKTSSSSPDQKAQQSSSKSPARSSDPGSSCRTRSSSAVQEVDKVQPTAAVEASSETPSEELMKDRKDTESSGAKSVKSDDEDKQISGAADGDQDNSFENQQTGPAGTQTLHEESVQTLGSTDNQPNPLKMETNCPPPGQEVPVPVVKKCDESEGKDRTLKKEEDKEKMFPGESHQTSEDPENLQNQIQNEEGVSKQDLNDSVSDVTDQPAFEILDSVDDQRAAGDEMISAGDDKQPEEEEDTFKIIDSVEEPQTSPGTESERDKGGEQTQKEEGSAGNDGRTSRRSGRTSKTSTTEEKEKPPKKHQPRMKTDTAVDKKVTEETEFEIVDSVEDASIQEDSTKDRSSRRRSTRGKKEEKMLDSVGDDKPATETNSPRGRRERTKMDASAEETRTEEMPTTRRRQTPARESRSREKTPPKETEESSPIKKTEEIFDLVQDQVVHEETRTTRGKGKRGRPKKQVETSKKDDAASKKSDEDVSAKVSGEEETTYQIVDSVEDESVHDQLPSEPSGTAGVLDQQEQQRTSPNGEEKEPIYEIVDSLGDDQVQEESEGQRQEQTDEDVTGTEASEKLGDKTESPHPGLDGSEKGHDVLCAAERSDTRKEEGITSENREKEGEPITHSENTPQEEQTPSSLMNLDEVSDEEEDYPDDSMEVEKLRKQSTKVQRAERRSRRGGGGGKGRSRERSEKKDEKDEVDAQELVTLDEVGADDATEEEEVRENQDEGGKIQEGDLLVTLDEFVEEETEGPETCPLSQDQQSPNTSNQKVPGTSDEEKKTENRAEKTSTPVKRKRDDDAEDSKNFVTVDEVGEEEEEEEKEMATPRRRGRAKRARRTPVRKSTKGKTVSPQEDEEKGPAHEPPSSSLDKDPPEVEVQKTAEEGAETQSTVNPVPVRPELEPENKTVKESVEEKEEGEEEEERRRTEIKALSKLRRELDGPGAKRSRSQSPSVPADFRLPSFKPNNPLGQEFVVPKTGYFCNLCSVFYHNESTAKETHCSSQKHYDNLKKYYKKLQHTSARSSLESSQGSVSD
ncbi:uncharacterized protein LOC117807351 isoform X2 [Xyrichtys novacula]|uniref:Uncharacterized protein LOC117807351 isoform X2 n=1 Tax=Xyrichtys novacula TaxID=13765 RepID=A0AAV1HIV4_XYRNO|nr:uncharacterized protein LOC117807351 isoform X2 [Xyrichtys novacula]